jgi:hypothetical protein
MPLQPPLFSPSALSSATALQASAQSVFGKQSVSLVASAVYPSQ